MHRSIISGHHIGNTFEKNLIDIHAYFVFLYCFSLFFSFRILYIYFVAPFLIFTGFWLSLLPTHGHYISNRNIFFLYGVAFTQSYLHILNFPMYSLNPYVMTVLWFHALIKANQFRLNLLLLPFIFIQYWTDKKSPWSNHIYSGILGLVYSMAMKLKRFQSLFMLAPLLFYFFLIHSSSL